MKKFFVILNLVFLCACVQPSTLIPADMALPESFGGVGQTDVLIYGGPGSWRAEIEALKRILYDHKATYEVFTPAQMNQMKIEDYDKYKAILFAGGDASVVRSALSSQTHANIREAVQSNGLNYLGFCAGAWIAVAPEAAPGEDVGYGIGVVKGPYLELNFLAKSGQEHTLDLASFPDGRRRNLLWYGGPVTPNISGKVVVKYSDGTPAISQIRSGKGLVVISGLHPAVTKQILDYIHIGNAEAIAPDFAWSLLEAVIKQKSLPTFH